MEVPVEVLAEVLDVSAGPSQCQWSPCGSQPIDSVGLGLAGEASAEVVLASTSLAVDVTEEMAEETAVEAGPSQCLYRRVLISALK